LFYNYFMHKILSQKFFQNENTVKIAKSLLGKFLIRRFKIPRKSVHCEVMMITEVEAYDGFKDKASHAHRGKTERNKIMFGSAGHWYVYFTYGIHWMLNIVTGPKEYPAAILIRSVLARPLSLPSTRSSATADSLVLARFADRGSAKTIGPGKAAARVSENRSRSHFHWQVINGPARLTKALEIDGKLNGQPANQKSGLWIEDRGFRIGNPPSHKASADNFHSPWRMKIKKSPRIGVDYAGPVWAKKRYRFYIKFK